MKRRILIPLLVCVLLAALLWLRWNEEYTYTPPQMVVESNIAMAGEKHEPVNFPALSVFDTVLERPLFSEDRRPFVPEPVVAQKPQAEHRTTTSASQLDDHRLKGVIIASGQRIALIQSSTNPRPRRVRQGEIVDGWTLTSVEAQGVTFTRDAESRDLPLMIQPSRVTVSSRDTIADNDYTEMTGVESDYNDESVLSD